MLNVSDHRLISGVLKQALVSSKKCFFKVSAPSPVDYVQHSRE